MALSQGSHCPPLAPSDPTSVSPGGTELGGGVPTRLSCASQVWRSGTPARTRRHKCLQDSSALPVWDRSARHVTKRAPDSALMLPASMRNPVLPPALGGKPIGGAYIPWPAGHLLAGGGCPEPGSGVRWVPGSVPQASICSLLRRGTRTPARWWLCTEGATWGSGCMENGQPVLFPGSPAAPYGLGCLRTSLGLSFLNCKRE